MSIDIKALTPELLPEYLRFFDQVAFTDNPEWASCYCAYYHHDPAEKPWDKRTGAENRDCASRLIQSGVLRGLLAYAGGEPVGWCNVNDKRAYAFLATDKTLWEQPEPALCSVVCFVIAPERRGRGVASALLSAACAAHRSGAFDFMEAYPRKNATGNAANYHGTLSMFRKAGFEVHRELESLWIVRKQLP